MPNCDSVLAKPANIDWQEALGENLEGFTVYEAVECEECGREVMTCSLGEDEHRYLEDDVDCMGTVRSEGPMMNYWYPLPGFDGDPAEAARKVAHLPFCVVEFANGDTGLALTGGGMDFSWEICAAYLALDYMPPLHFCELPDMAGKHNEAGWENVVNACIESADTAKSWAERTMVRLDDLRAKLNSEAA